MTKENQSPARRFLPKYLYAMAVLPWLFSRGVFSARDRFLIFQIAKHFGMRMPEEPQLLPVTRLNQIVEGHLDVTLLELLVEGGNVSLLELLVIARLARSAKIKTAFEIGTFDGRTTLNLAANLGPEGQVFTLDLPATDVSSTKFELAPGESAFVEKKQSGTRFLRTPYEQQVTQLYGDSASFDFAPYEGKMGLVFVDGSHSYDYVRQDTLTALRLASADGIILWHDYQQDWPGVIRALNEAQQSNPVCRQLRRIEGTSLVMLRRENISR